MRRVCCSNLGRDSASWYRGNDYLEATEQTRQAMNLSEKTSRAQPGISHR